MKKLIFLWLFVFVYVLLNSSQIPDWVKKRPIDKDYYIGIGVAKIDKKNKNYIEIAKENALKNLSSEISVNVSGEVLSKVSEQNGKLKELLQSSVKTTTKAFLEGYELVDTYRDKNNYWVYYRLSKALYKKKIDEKTKREVDRAFSLYKNAKRFEKTNNPVASINFLLKSLEIIKNFPNEKVLIEGKKTFLINRIISDIRAIFENIGLKITPNKINLKFNKNNRKFPRILAFYKKEDRKIPNLLLDISFIRGRGEIVKKELTDSNGEANIHIIKITAPDKLQIVKVSLDRNQIVPGDSLSVLGYNILKTVPIKSQKLFINVTGLSVFINSSEKILNKETSIKYLAPKIKGNLQKDNIQFVDDIAKADAVINIFANTQKGSEFYGMTSAFADVTVSIVDTNTGKEIYKNTFSHIKGIDKDYQKASQKALSEGASEIAKEILHILKEKF